ncbi:MAG: hypothetical protein KJ880_07270 [Candidatus Omnitrophica bacterium]|nr:hypothetical protein [Candidatus Omnitrophota bacterium]MBU1870187.1 hypothetical protein [Candidatus Omnitrophota bacterium]
MNNHLWPAVGAAAALLTMFSFVPQIIKGFRTKSVKDVSIITLVQLSIGVSLWMLYGAYLRDRIIIVANAITLTSLVILLVLYFIYGRKA